MSIKKLCKYDKSLKITLDNHYYKVPKIYEKETEKNWEKVNNFSNKQSRPIWNGSTFHVDEISEDGKNIKICKSNYKTYISSEVLRTKMLNIPFKDRINGLYIATHILTADDFFILGKTSNNSLFDHKVDLISNTVDGDIQLSNNKSLENLVKLTIKEELGINKSYIKSIKGLSILQTSSGRIGIFFLTKLKIDKNHFNNIITLNYQHSNIELIKTKDMVEYLKNTSPNPTILFSYKDIILE